MTHPHSLALLSPAMWELYRDLRLSSLLDSPDAFGGTHALEAARPVEVWQSRLAAAATSGLDLPLLARVGELPAGLCWAKRDAAYLSVVNVYQMWVAPECRGVGTGGRCWSAAWIGPEPSVRRRFALGSRLRTARLTVSTFGTASCRWARRSLFVKGHPSSRRPCHSVSQAMPDRPINLGRRGSVAPGAISCLPSAGRFGRAGGYSKKIPVEVA